MPSALARQRVTAKLERLARPAHRPPASGRGAQRRDDVVRRGLLQPVQAIGTELPQPLGEGGAEEAHHGVVHGARHLGAEVRRPQHLGELG